MGTKQKTNFAETAITPKNKRVTVTVKAHDLFALNYPPTESQIDDNTALSDEEGFGSGYGNPNKNYETIVYMGKEMIWDIDLSDKTGVDKGYRVSLDYVKHSPKPGNPNFFDCDELNAGSDGKIRGAISIDPDLPNKDDSYTINFIITNPPNSTPYESKEFVIDPKLRINS